LREALSADDSTDRLAQGFLLVLLELPEAADD